MADRQTPARPVDPALALPGAPAAYPQGWSNFWNVWWTRAAGMPAVDAARRERFAALVRFARRHSPFYRETWRGLPSIVLEPEALPVATKRALMARFEDWVTDPAIRRTDVDAFIADRAHVGERFNGRYIVWKSSGSTGEPGIYIQDDASLATYDALVGVQAASLRLVSRCAAGWLRGGRAALVAATGDHFASIASWERACRSTPGIDARGFSILLPMDELVAELNAFAPSYLASYPTLLALLAAERAEGRLRIAPEIVWSGGECLAPAMRLAIERAFGCPVLNEYGSSECMSIAFGCHEGWLHVNADWVILEPVDADYQPVAPGEVSATVLLTNLANRVQPVIRYDLGDTVVASPAPCRCGNPLPAIRVEGRREDVITMRAAGGRPVRLPPMALTTVVEEASGVSRFQIVQSAPATLRLRFDVDQLAQRNAAFERAAQALRKYLAQHGIPRATVALDKRRPATDRRSGKLRQVVAADADAPPPPAARRAGRKIG